VSWGQLAAGIAAARYPAPAAARPNHLWQVDAEGDFFGLAGDGGPVTRAEAMSVPAMARARHLIVKPARLPIAVEPLDYPHTTLIDQPDPSRTRAAVHSATLDDLLFHGVAVWLVTARYAHDDRPRHARHIPHPLTAVTVDGGGQWRVDGKPVPARDLLWFEGPHEGVLSFAGRPLRAAVSLDRAYAATAANPNAATELHQTSGDPLTDTEIGQLVAATRQAISQRGVVFTNEALELRTHAAVAENLLISGRNAAAVDIARMAGLPAPLIDAYPVGSSATYSNVQARLREARDIGIDDYARAVTDRLSLDDVLPRGVTCSHKWESLLRNDFQARMDGYTAAQAAGVYTVEECRDIERGTSPISEGRAAR